MREKREGERRKTGGSTVKGWAVRGKGEKVTNRNTDEGVSEGGEL